ncbi:EthD protein [Bordetella ansorpii]|uniref:EthD protein n=2 Tax=Bordetella ansorpii TaxID=288768 RepID=A0A157SVW8_9BORD|nr:EthD protein [Bordetella ansorpii]
MIKHISLINRHQNESVADFRAYWLNVHSQLVKGALPGLRKYVANFPVDVSDSEPLASGRHLSCDAIVELHFDSLDALKAAIRSPDWQSEKRKASSARLMELSLNQYMIAEEVSISLDA